MNIHWKKKNKNLKEKKREKEKEKRKKWKTWLMMCKAKKKPEMNYLAPHTKINPKPIRFYISILFS